MADRSTGLRGDDTSRESPEDYRSMVLDKKDSKTSPTIPTEPRADRKAREPREPLSSFISMFLGKKDREPSLERDSGDLDSGRDANRNVAAMDKADKHEKSPELYTKRESWIDQAIRRSKQSSPHSPIFPDTSPNAPPPTTGGGSGLFGSSTQQQLPTAGGSGLFGGSTQQQLPTAGGSGLFGSSTQQQIPTAGGSGLFGSSSLQQPAATGGTGIFGGSTQQPTTTGGSGLFSTNLNNSSGPSLFGGNVQQQNTGTNGLFGASSQQQQQNVNSGSSLFGGAQQQQPTSSLFGSRPAQTLPTSGSTLFGTTNSQQQQANAGSSLFGQQQQQQPSLFGAAQAASFNNPAPFAARLGMGQGTITQGSTAVPAVKIDFDGLRPTTRYEELTDQMKAQLDQVDGMIQQQENFHNQIQAIMPNHGQGIASLGPDVEFVKDKVDAVETALANDAHGVHGQNRVATKDTEDVKRCQRNIVNLNLPQAYQYAKLGYASPTNLYGSQGTTSVGGHLNHPGHRENNVGSNVQGSSVAPTYAADLVGEYFVPIAAEMQSIIENYTKNLAEIEQHMQVIESSAIGQAQQLAQRRAGHTDSPSHTGEANATMRELADTLRGFEASILAIAGAVGECREGVNELVVGRMNGRYR